MTREFGEIIVKTEVQLEGAAPTTTDELRAVCETLFNVMSHAGDDSKEAS